MNVLIIGGGGREHALAWKAAQSPLADCVYVAPGNAGTAGEAGVENVSIAAEDIAGLVAFAREKQVGLTIVGPEAPLVAGVVDAFRDAGLKCFGPSRTAAELEGSKAFSKDFLARHRIPTADYRTFTEVEAATDYIRRQGAPIVVKADGLAAGKGVVVALTEEEAIAAVQDMLAEGTFGAAGSQVVVEECLQGEEASFIVMVDGEHVLPLATSQDHKARDDGDTGPNTGGMGAYSPAPVVTRELHRQIMSQVIEPTVRGLAADGRPYTGFLYAGLMIGADGVPKVLEYNCRFGDPETQPIMMRLRSDLVELCLAAIDGRLGQVKADWDPRAALGVVMAAGGYPGSYRKGDPIEGLMEEYPPDAKIFHAGTASKDGEVVTNGGRVLCACALGDTVAEAQERAYQLVRTVRWSAMFYRTDIGHRAVSREAAGGQSSE
jgi:phosphoribosylamine---glycine ligase